MAGKPKIAMLVHPNMVLLDHLGPHTVFNILGAEIFLVWKTRDAVSTDVGIAVTPTHTFATCPVDIDVLFVPGGLGGTIACLQDDDVLTFLKRLAGTAQHVVGICTGSLLLGAAGLLRGQRATTHWYAHDLLALSGAEAVQARVVQSGKFLTGGGVTAGLDVALTLAAQLADETTAKRIQLVLEYDPQPPFKAGSPQGAGEALTTQVLNSRAPVLAKAREALIAACARAGAA